MKKIVKLPTYLRNLKYGLIYMMKYNLFEREKDFTYELTEKIIEDCVYEYEETKEILPMLNILDEDESIGLLKNYPKSFSRFGDGEIQIMKGYNQPFQRYNPILAKRLTEILANDSKEIYIGLNRAYFHTPLGCSEQNKRFYRLYNGYYRRFFIEHCNKDQLFLDAGCLTAYYRFDDKYDYAAHYEKVLDLFDNKKIAVVCGQGIMDKLRYNVFERAEKQMIINAPIKDAFEQYDHILDKILKSVPIEYTVCLILGMTAKVLVYDLTMKGYMAWDVGHLAKDYDAYMNNLEKTAQNITSFWAPD